MRKILYVSAVVAAMTVGALGLAGAGEAVGPPFISTPSDGTPPVVISVSDDGQSLPECEWQVVVTLQTDPPIQVLAEMDYKSVPIGWSASLTVPEGTPPGTYQLDASCQFPSQGAVPRGTTDGGPTFNYAPNRFSVLGAQVQDRNRNRSDPADPVEAEPSFTG